jgi:hypothetical protein
MPAAAARCTALRVCAVPGVPSSAALPRAHAWPHHASSIACNPQTDEFHEQWRIKARDVLARAEWRRRKLTKRVRQALPGLLACQLGRG